MPASGSIFVDFQLPNATTWFYFSLLLAIGLFFKFRPFLSIRNWDVGSISLLGPALLLLQEAPHLARELPLPSREATAQAGTAGTTSTPADQVRWLGYLWLLCGSGYFLIRCLVDLTLVRRPSLAPNLSLGGLAWLGGALFVCLVSVAVRPPEESLTHLVGKPSAGLVEMGRQVETAA